MDKFEKIRQEYDKISSALTVVSPFISSLLRRVRIILTKQVPTAGVTKGDILAINPDFWLSLEADGKAWVLGHEVFHIAFRDAQRLGRRDPYLWNIVTDSINNDMLQEMIRVPYSLRNMIWDTEKLWQTFHEVFEKANLNWQDIGKRSKEEIYNLLPKGGKGGQRPKCPKCGSEKIRIKKLSLSNGYAIFKCDDCGHEWKAPIQEGYGGMGGFDIPIDEIEGLDPDLLKKDKLEGKVLQEGDPEIYESKEDDPDAREEKWRDRIVRAYSAQKMAGRMPGRLKRMIDRLLNPKVSWETILRQAIITGLGKTIVASYRRPSRKHPSLPGSIRYTIPKLYFLVDMSGSMSDEEVTQAMTELYAVAKKCEFAVICWDGERLVPCE